MSAFLKPFRVLDLDPDGCIRRPGFKLVNNNKTLVHLAIVGIRDEGNVSFGLKDAGGDYVLLDVLRLIERDFFFVT